MERNSLMLYLSYQAQIMDKTIDISIQEQITNSLLIVFKKLIQTDNPEIRKDWEIFCQLDESIHFWKKLEDIYRALMNWSLKQNGKQQLLTYNLMATILGFSILSIREKYGEGFLKDVISNHPGKGSYQIIRTYFNSLEYSEDRGRELSENLVKQLKLISDNMLPKITDLPEPGVIELLSDIGFELGIRDIKLAMDNVRTLLTLDYALEFKTSGLLILSGLAQYSYTNFIQFEYHIKLYEPIYNLFDKYYDTVIERDNQFNEVDDLRNSSGSSSSRDSITSSDLNNIDDIETLLASVLHALSHLHIPLEKGTNLIEKISKLAYSPVFDVAESALFCLRDILLINPGQYLVFVLTQIQNTMSSYFEGNEGQIQRSLHNMSVILYYFNQAIEMDFDLTGISLQKFTFLRYRIEGTLLVWLCSPFNFVYSNCWRVLEQITSTQIRKLESTNEQPCKEYLIDFLPRKRRTAGGNLILSELPTILENNYNSIIFSINWAFSNLYEVACQSNSFEKSGTLTTWSNYFRLLCIIPRHPPSNASYDDKAQYLSKGIIGRLFNQIGLLLQNDDKLLHVTTESLKVLHESCYDDLINSIKSISEEKEQQKKDNNNIKPIYEKPIIISLFRQFICNMNSKVFLDKDNNISHHFDNIFSSWISGDKKIPSDFGYETKKDIILILERIISFYGDVSKIITPSLLEENNTFSSKIILIMNFVDKLINDKNDINAIQCNCAQVELLTTILSLNEKIDSFDKIEKEIMRICCIEEYLQEFSDCLFKQYLLNYPDRLIPILHLSLEHSPSITENNHNNNDKKSYSVCIPILRAVVNVLSGKNYGKYVTSTDITLQLVFISLFYQCSFEIVVRMLAIDIAHLISKLNIDNIQQVHRVTKQSKNQKFNKKISPREKSVLGYGSYESIALDKISNISTDFLPCSSHMNREIYLRFAKKFSKEISSKLDSHTRDAIQSIQKLMIHIKYASDKSLMLVFVKPWACNYATSVKNPPRWIIHALYDLSILLGKDPALIGPLENLWEEMVLIEPLTVIRIGFEWIFEMCYNELKKPIVDQHAVKICTLAAISLIKGSSNNASAKKYVTNYLINQLRTYPTFNLSNNDNNIKIDEIREWLNEKKSLPEDFCTFKERTALIFLIPLSLVEDLFDVKKVLPLMLHSAFVLDDPVGDFAYIGVGKGSDLVANVLHGIHNRFYGDKNYTYERLGLVRRNYFPDSARIESLESPLSLTIQEEEKTNIKLGSSRRRATATTRSSNPVYIPFEKTTRLVDSIQIAV